MADDYAIAIRIDDAAASAEVDRFTGKLGKAEEAASRIGKAFREVGPAIELAGVALGAHEVFHLTNAYGELSNRLRSVSGDQEQFNSLMRQTEAVARDTRTEWNEVGFTYQRIAKATEHLGTTQADVMRLTKEISQGLALSGASAQEARMSMAELTHAFELGTLTGREFKVLLKDATPIIGELAKGLGVSRAAFIEMGKHGKITAEMLMEGFNKAAPSIQAQFDKLTPTLDQSITQLKNSFEKLLGSVASALGVFEKLNKTLGDIGGALSLVGDAAKAAGDATSSLKDAAGDAGPVVGKALDIILNPIKSGIGAVKDLAGLAKEGLHELSASMESDAGKAAHAYLAQLDAVTRLAEQEEKLGEIDRTLKAARAAGIEAPQFDLNAARNFAAVVADMKATTGVTLATPFAEAAKKADELDKAMEKFKEHRAEKKLKEGIEDAVNAMTGFNKSLDDNEEHWKSIDRKIKDVDGALAKIAERRKLILKPGEDPLVQMEGKGAQDAIDITRQEQELLTKKATLTNEVANSEYRWGKEVADNKNAFLEHKLAIEATTSAIRDGKYTTEEAAFAWKKLGLELDHASKLLLEIRKPGLEYQKDVAALNFLLARGKIAFFEYENAIRKATDAYAGSELRQILEAGTRTPKPLTQVSLGGGALAGGMFDEAIDRAGNVSRARAEALQKYEEEVRKATFEAEQEYARPAEPDLERDLAGYDKTIASLTQTLERIRAPQREHTQGLADANQLFGETKISAKEYADEINRLEEAYFGATHAGKSFEDGLARGLHSIRNEVTDVASQIETTLKDAFHGAEEALVSFVTTGEVNFKQLTRTILADMTRLIERQAFAALLGAIGGSGGGIPSVLGTGATQAFPGLFGSAPGYASGGEGRIPGSGPADSRLFVARVTPGEYFRFTPPGGGASSAPAQQSGPTVVRVVATLDDSVMHDFMEQHGETYHLRFSRRNAGRG